MLSLELQSMLEQGALHAARHLLGCKLLLETTEGRVGGYIVETEAYVQEDPASHTFMGETARNAAMFQAAGTIYIYFTYGMHYCVNIVTGPIGHGEGVLIRALEPVEGIEIMEKNRQKTGKDLTSGPAKLVKALGIPSELNGKKLGDKLILEPGYKPVASRIQVGKRVGISKAVEELARFYISDNKFVSRK